MGKPSRKSLAAAPPPVPPKPGALLRGLRQPAIAGRTFDSFDQALACTDYGEKEPIIEWKSLENVAALDVDFHDGYKPDLRHLEKVIRDVRPSPKCGWITHGGGLRLIFSAIDPLSAEEVAAIARVALKKHSPCDRASAFEIKKTTRHPAYPRTRDGIVQRCGSIIKGTGGGLDGARNKLLGNIGQQEIDPARLEEWLEENGYVMGERYDHDYCPVAPSPHGKSKPVCVLDSGIFCHACEAAGRQYKDAGKAGFASYTRLIDDEPIRVTNHLRNAVRGLAHWQHAKYIIDDETAYRGLLKLWHIRGEDDAKDELYENLIGKVFFPEIPLVRVNDAWMKPDFTPVSDKVIDGLVAQLPAVKYAASMPKGGYKEATAPVPLNVLRGDFDLTGRGYPNLIPLRGMDMATMARRDNDPRIFAHVPASPPFRYRSQQDMGKVAARLEECFPGVDFQLLKLLVASKGLQQQNAVDVPRIWITGQSGSGKTTSILLAASICCDVASECIFKDSYDRFIRSFADASLCGSFAYINEIDKTGLDRSELKSRLLDFDANKSYHRLHVGTQKIKHPAVLAMTGTMLPSFLLEDEQIARRYAFVDLGPGRHGISAANWKDTCRAPSAASWRNGDATGDNVDVCDMFVSEIMDACFGSLAAPTFEQIVHWCGFKMLNEMSVSADDDLRRLYGAVTAGPAWTGGSRWLDDGWRVYDKHDRSKPAMQLFDEITDDGTDFQPLTAANWSRITGTPRMMLAIREHGKRIGLRFFVDQRGGRGQR